MAHLPSIQELGQELIKEITAICDQLEADYGEDYISEPMAGWRDGRYHISVTLRPAVDPDATT